MSEGEGVLRQIWTLLNSWQIDTDELKSLLHNGKLMKCLLRQLPVDDQGGRQRILPGILLHYAATQHDSDVLCTVLTLYRRKGCLPEGLLARNVHQQTPLMAALSIQEPSLPNVLIMCQTCKEVAPGAFIMTDGSGNLHTTVPALLGQSRPHLPTECASSNFQLNSQ
jgi:hypothetical protein